MSFTNRGPKGRGVWRAVPFIKNDALENCLIKILRSESPGKTINKNFGVKAKKNLVSYLCMQKFVLKSDTHVRCIKFHRKVNMCETFPAQVYGWNYWYLSFSNNRTFFCRFRWKALFGLKNQLSLVNEGFCRNQNILASFHVYFANFQPN